MSATQARDRAAALAKSDTPAALQAARKVSDPWYRAQALAWVARFAPDRDVERIAAESLEACRECEDLYQRLAPPPWPLRALAERGAFRTARSVLNPLLKEELNVQPSSSRSEALFLLFQACLDLDSDSREVLIQKLAAAHHASGHWRSRRNLIDALSMLIDRDPRLAAEVIGSLADERVRRKAEAFTSPDRRRPRPFFW
jgi:hypothetical protein